MSGTRSETSVRIDAPSGSRAIGTIVDLGERVYEARCDGGC